MTIRDFTELDRQIDNAEAHALDPEAPGRKWMQGNWVNACGTYGCIAGNTVLDAGYRIGFGNRPLRTPEGTLFGGFEISHTAIQVLGLTWEEGHAIFNGANTIGVLRRLQKDLHDGQPINTLLATAYQIQERKEREAAAFGEVLA